MCSTSLIRFFIASIEYCIVLFGFVNFSFLNRKKKKKKKKNRLIFCNSVFKCVHMILLFLSSKHFFIFVAEVSDSVSIFLMESDGTPIHFARPFHESLTSSQIICITSNNTMLLVFSIIIKMLIGKIPFAQIVFQIVFQKCQNSLNRLCSTRENY